MKKKVLRSKLSLALALAMMAGTTVPALANETDPVAEAPENVVEEVKEPDKEAPLPGEETPAPEETAPEEVVYKATVTIKEGEEVDLAKLVFTPELPEGAKAIELIGMPEKLTEGNHQAKVKVQFTEADVKEVDLEVTVEKKEAEPTPEKPEDVKELEAKIAELEKELAAKKEELANSGKENTELKKQIAGLEKQIAELKEQVGAKANKDLLTKLVKKLEAVNEKELNYSLRKKYKDLLQEAKALVALKNASQKQIDDVNGKILSLMDEIEKANKDLLTKLVKKLEAVNEKELSYSLRRKYEDLLQEAKALVALKNASQKQIDDVNGKILSLMDEIEQEYVHETKKEALKDLVYKAEKLDVREFDRKDRYEFEDLLKKAKEVLKDEKATQREVEKAEKDLRKFLETYAKENKKSALTKDIVKMLNVVDSKEINDTLQKIRKLFNLKATETKTLNKGAELNSLKYIFTINSDKFAEVTNREINVYKIDTVPFISNSRTMVPLRYAAYTLGAEVSWNQSTMTATFTRDGVSAYIKLGSNEVNLSNGKKFLMDQAPILRNDRMHVSISNVAKIFGLSSGNVNDGGNHTIEWDQANKAVIVYVQR